MKHKWVNASGFTFQCSICKDFDDISADPCDTDGIAKEMERIINRVDCPGKKKKRKVKTKTKYSRNDLLLVTEDHGGYEAGICVLCKATGWIDEIKHKPSCPLSDTKVNVLEVNDVRKI